MQTEKDRILELRKALEYHNYKYYIENAPEISDREFDGLMHDLELLSAISAEDVPRNF
jgi:DNA ligase (NAD+)